MATGDLVALAKIEHKGKVYNWGDPVTAEVAEANPTAVGPAPLTATDIDKMNKDELAATLKRLTGNDQTEATE